MEETKVNETEYKPAETKFCKECGQKIAAKAVICPHCGCQVEETQAAQPQIVINNSNQNSNQNVTAGVPGNAKNKWVAFLLCFFFGYLGAHKFYEGRILGGILYLFTGGLLGFGALIDCIIILCKPNTYYV